MLLNITTVSEGTGSQSPGERRNSTHAGAAVQRTAGERGLRTLRDQPPYTLLHERKCGGDVVILEGSDFRFDLHITRGLLGRQRPHHSVV